MPGWAAITTGISTAITVTIVSIITIVSTGIADTDPRARG
jgi:hypothetical protein